MDDVTRDYIDSLEVNSVPWIQYFGAINDGNVVSTCYAVYIRFQKR